MVIIISAISITSLSISTCAYSSMTFFLFLTSSMISGFNARLLPIIKIQRVFRDEGGNPCFQRDYRSVVLIVKPELLVLSCKFQFFLSLVFQQEQNFYIPRAIQPFSFGFLFLQSQWRSQNGKISLFQIYYIVSLLIVLLCFSYI